MDTLLTNSDFICNFIYICIALTAIEVIVKVYNELKNNDNDANDN